MMMRTGMIALADSFRDMTSGVQVLDALENTFKSFGATHFLATGLPLPGRHIDPLVVRMTWGDLRPGSLPLTSEDPVLRRVMRVKRPHIWLESNDSVEHVSPLLGLLGTNEAQIIGISVYGFLPYQAAVVAAGRPLAIDVCALITIDHVCVEAFRQLFNLGFIRPERPGELSARERRVVELSASGKTASEIASILQISQRTVHAHLQNASEKLAAHNKTHTVVEALRFGQISV